MAVKKKIHDRVLFLGKQDRINEKLAVADVLLLPSELESFGLAALEAMTGLLYVAVLIARLVSLYSKPKSSDA